MSLDKEILGKKIKQIRIEKGISQEKLSEKIDISPRQMCTIENGNSFPYQNCRNTWNKYQWFF